MTTPQDKTYGAVVVPALARKLHADTIVQYNETGGYTENPNRPAVVFGVLPASPLTAVSIMCYNESRTGDEYNPEVYVQLRFRAGGSPLAVERLANKPFALLHWAENHPLEIWPGGVAILLSRHLSRTPIIQSGTNQYERADSYRLNVNPGEM